MALSIGPLLSEISSTAEASPVARLFPFVLCALGILVAAAIVLGLRHQGKQGKKEDLEE